MLSFYSGNISKHYLSEQSLQTEDEPRIDWRHNTNDQSQTEDHFSIRDLWSTQIDPPHTFDLEKTPSETG